MKNVWKISLVFLLLPTACSSSKRFMKMKEGQPYGSSIELKYADKLWSALKKNRLVGKKAYNSTPNRGNHPHGVVVETLSGKIKVLDHEGTVYVHRNYGGQNVSRSRVAKFRHLYLQSISVMMKRKRGYDSDNGDWFWVEYNKDGKVIRKIDDFLVAGRVAKGKKTGCIACHSGAPGGDHLFSNTAMHLDR